MAEQGKTQSPAEGGGKGAGKGGNKGGGNQGGGGGGKDAFVTEITPQSEDFSRWYLDVVRRAELADYSPVKGCMVIRPYGYAIWELIQQAFDKRFKATGHVNAYFPLFIPESLLQTEAEHVEGFAPQVAWVTKGGTEELEERLAIRPTSEVIIGTMYAKWIQSWRDLPVLINQWANVVRWEKVTRPFLRTTEFLWQEGHTAHETEEDALEETLKILAIYKEVAESVLGMPVVDGPKSDSEKFAGASKTYSIEALMGDGRALQAGTSHHLGQNFAKAFNITFQARDKTLQHVWTTSWGVSTRLIGGVIMTHGDDSGLVLPPKIAPYQVVIVPIPRGNWQETVLPKARELRDQLQAAGVRVMLDDRDAYTPGWKFSEWELRGVPLRLEIGPKDIEKGTVFSARRDTREKAALPMDGLAASVQGLLDTIQTALYQKALKFREEHTVWLETYEEFKQAMDGRPGYVVVPWAWDSANEAQVKTETQATIRNVPFSTSKPEGKKCMFSGKPADVYAYFAKSY
jgi:prolyl-tRNA synthetase